MCRNLFLLLGKNIYLRTYMCICSYVVVLPVITLEKKKKKHLYLPLLGCPAHHRVIPDILSSSAHILLTPCLQKHARVRAKYLCQESIWSHKDHLWPPSLVQVYCVSASHVASFILAAVMGEEWERPSPSSSSESGRENKWVVNPLTVRRLSGKVIFKIVIMKGHTHST